MRYEAMRDAYLRNPEWLGWDTLQQLNEAAGRHYFDADTMRFFRSRRIGEGARRGTDGRYYFCTSEKGPDEIRAYSVRAFDPETGGIDTVRGFQAYATRTAALRARDRVAAGKEVAA